MNLFAELIRTAPLVHPHPGVRDFLSRAKYCARGLVFPGLTRAWFELLQTPQLTIIPQSHPHILSKLQRAYLDRTPGPRQRLERLKHHYRFLTERFSAEMIAKIYGADGLRLATIPLEEVGQFGLRFTYLDSLGKEGEMSVSFHDESSGAILFALSFCITRFETERKEIFVGGLQGFQPSNERELIVAITRAMYGLRPKALLLFTLQQLACLWEFNSLRAVSNANHVYRHYRKRKTVSASYDEFWLECGGQLAADGMFELPLTAAPRDLAELKASKRAMYKRRYVMLDGIAEQIRAHWSESRQPARLARAQPLPIQRDFSS